MKGGATRENVSIHQIKSPRGSVPGFRGTRFPQDPESGGYRAKREPISEDDGKIN